MRTEVTIQSFLGREKGELAILRLLELVMLKTISVVESNDQVTFHKTLYIKMTRKVCLLNALPYQLINCLWFGFKEEDGRIKTVGHFLNLMSFLMKQLVNDGSSKRVSTFSSKVTLFDQVIAYGLGPCVTNFFSLRPYRNDYGN